MTEAVSKSLVPRTWTIVLVAVVLLVGCGVLMVLWPHYREQQVIACIDGLGGKAESEIVRPTWIQESIDDVFLILFERVSVVDLSDTQVCDADLEQLEGLTNLRELHLDYTEITDAGLVHLQGLKNLETLILDNTQVSDEGLKNLKELTQLYCLCLGNTNVGDDGIQHLQSLPQLSYLHLDGTQVGDAAVEYLLSLRKLEYIVLRDSQFTITGIQNLKKSPQPFHVVWSQASE